MTKLKLFGFAALLIAAPLLLAGIALATAQQERQTSEGVIYRPDSPIEWAGQPLTITQVSAWLVGQNNAYLSMWLETSASGQEACDQFAQSYLPASDVNRLLVELLPADTSGLGPPVAFYDGPIGYEGAAADQSQNEHANARCAFHVVSILAPVATEAEKDKRVKVTFYPHPETNPKLKFVWGW